MKKVLKGWLIDNSVTTDNKTDKILLLASAGSLTLDDVLEEMYKQDTGLRPETMRHSVTLYHRIVISVEYALEIACTLVRSRCDLIMGVGIM